MAVYSSISAALSGIRGYCGSISGFLGGAPEEDVYSQQSSRNQSGPKLQVRLKLFIFLFFLLLGFFLIRWGLWRWNGIYCYPDGRVGENLAALSYFIGVIVWIVGVVGFLAQIGNT
jgi:hypothetical protein